MEKRKKLNKTILISGATGLIGRALVNELLSRGCNIYILTNRKESAVKLFPTLNKNVFSWREINDLNNTEIDAIINLSGKNVGEKRWKKRVKKEIYDSRVHSTRRLVEHVKTMKFKPEVFINASGVDYYGNRGDEVVTEESSPGYDFLSEVCIDWEKEAYNAIDYGVRVVIIRAGFVFARNSPALKKLVFPFRLFAGGIIGSGRQYFSWVHMYDLIRIYLMAVENNGLSGAVNASAPNPVSMRELCLTIGKVLKRPVYLPILPVFLKIAMGRMSEIVISGRKAIPKKLINNGFVFTYYNIIDTLTEMLKKY